MRITKIETNYNRNIFFNKTSNIKLKRVLQNIEFQVINIYPNINYQKIIGFGGAFTESTGYSLDKVNKDIANNIIDDYFSENGLKYSLCRLPIGSSDFSIDSYSYSNEDSLEDFNIEKDMKFVIPAVKMAQIRNRNIKFLASPWSPPKFMKNNKSLYNGGKLLNKYKSAWTNYLIKYVKSYKEKEITINYMTIQNEPNASQVWESCLYNASEESDLLKNYLFPAFRENNIEMNFLIWDHNKEKLLNRTITTLNDSSSFNSASGIAFHWYTGDHFENINLLRSLFPNKLLIHTEGCTGYSNFNNNDEIQNGEIYAHDIIGDLNAGINGFIDWNMVLDYYGGPNHKKNYCNSPIMINKEFDGYIKNLTYYYIGHFSKFILPGAKRIAYSKYTDCIEITAFKNVNGTIVIVLLNRTNNNKEFNLCYKDYVFHDNLDSHAIVTFIIED